MLLKLTRSAATLLKATCLHELYTQWIIYSLLEESINWGLWKCEFSRILASFAFSHTNSLWTALFLRPLTRRARAQQLTGPFRWTAFELQHNSVGAARPTTSSARSVRHFFLFFSPHPPPWWWTWLFPSSATAVFFLCLTVEEKDCWSTDVPSLSPRRVKHVATSGLSTKAPPHPTYPPSPHPTLPNNKLIPACRISIHQSLSRRYCSFPSISISLGFAGYFSLERPSGQEENLPRTSAG